MHLFLAGAETFHDLMMEHDAPFRLYTYYALRNDKRLGSKLGDLRRLKKEKPWVRIFLDSGAFSIVADYFQKRRKIDLHAYGENYCDFVEQYHELFDIVAELDIEATNQIHRDYVWKWYDRLWAAAGKKLIYVWHPHRGLQEYGSILNEEDHRWIGIAANTAAKYGTGKAMQMIGAARRAGKHVHGFGQTRIQTDLKFTRWTSADSSTWLAGDKYGATFVFRGGKLTRLSSFEDKQARARQRKLLRKYFEKIGVDPKRIEADEVEEVRKSSLIAWILFARRMYEVGKRNGGHLIWNEPPWVSQEALQERAVSNSDTPKERPKLPSGNKLRLKTRKKNKLDISDQGIPKNPDEKDMGVAEPTAIAPLPETDFVAFMRGKNKTAKERDSDSFYAILGNLTSPAVMSREEIQATRTGDEETTIRAVSAEAEDDGKSPYLEKQLLLPLEGVEEKAERGIGGEGTSDVRSQSLSLRLGPRSSAQEVTSGKSLPVVQGSQKADIRGVSTGAVIGAAMQALPRLACSSCAIADDCPEFQDGYLCAYNDLFQGLSTRRAENVVPLMQTLVDTNVQRTMMAVLQERLVAGGQLDSRVSAQLNQALQQLQAVHSINRANDPANARLVVEDNGGRMSVSAEGPSQPGFLARLFGGGSPTPTDSVEINPVTQGAGKGGHAVVDAQPSVIDATPEQGSSSVPSEPKE